MSKIKKLLIAGGGYADIPLINAARNLGWYVITSGNRANDLGHQYSNQYALADFSDPEAILDIAKKYKINAICPCANDFSAISCAYTAEKLGLPGYDSYENTLIIHHKDRYRSFALKNNIPTPLAFGFSSYDEAKDSLNSFKYPIIIKPVDLTGGKGIKKVYDFQEAIHAIKDAFLISKSKRIVIEEFIEGSQHGFTSILIAKKVSFYLADNEHYYLNQYMVSGASTPSNVSKQVMEDLIKQTEIIAEVLNLQDGIFHIQFIVSNNKPTIIEICRRPPGDLYIKFVSIATGINYPELIMRPYLGLEYDSLFYLEPKLYLTRHCVMADREGIVENVMYENSIKDKIIDELVLWQAGMHIDSYLTTKLAILFLKFESKNEMLEITDRLNEYIDIKFQ